MSTADAACLPATELCARLRARTVSAVDLVEAVLARIARFDPALHAYITVTADAAREAARVSESRLASGNLRGPLEGLPYSLKDLVFTAGVRTTGGSRVYEQFVPAESSVVARRLESAGGVLLGKTSTPEFGFKGTTENLIVGDTGNPWALDRTAGGSSGGAAAAVATGLSPLAIGTDGGGSIRIPASCCGVVGFKPTFGVVPDRPGFGGGRTISHTGPLARTVADCALAMDVVAVHDEGTRSSVPHAPGGYLAALEAPLPPLRVGYSATLGYAPVDPDVAASVAAAVHEIERAGWVVEAADPGFGDPYETFNTIIRAENHVAAAPLLEKHAELLDPGMRAFTENGARVTAREYLEAQRARDGLTETLARYFEQFELLVTPTLAVAPFPLNTRPQGIAGQAIHGVSWIAFTYPFNLTGNPAVSLPCGLSPDGLPIGVQIVGPRHADARVLAAAAAVERLLAFPRTLPPGYA